MVSLFDVTPNRKRSVKKKTELEPITILVDTREQLSYEEFSPSVTTMKTTLLTGDYSVYGFTNMIAVERKTLEDYLHSLIDENERFFNEIKRLSKMPFARIVVEANWDDIVLGRWKKNIKPKSIIKLTYTVEEVYKVPVNFCSNRQAAIVHVESWLRYVKTVCSHRKYGVPT